MLALILVVLADLASGTPKEDPRWSNAVRLDDGSLFLVGIKRFWIRKDGRQKAVTAPDELGDEGGHNVTARLGPDRLLVVEGWRGAAFRFDVAARRFSPLPKLPMKEVTFAFVQVLSDGKILVLGNHHAVLFDPAGSWRDLGDVGFDSQAAVAVGDQIVVSGGNMRIKADENDLFKVDIPASSDQAQRLSISDSLRRGDLGPLLQAREQHSATLLRDGRILIAGGREVKPREDFDFHHGFYMNVGHALSSVEILDPKSGRSVGAAPLKSARNAHAAVLLDDGRVMVMGGQNDKMDKLASVEIYDPVKNQWSAGRPMKRPRCYPTPVRVSPNQLLIGGFDGPEETYELPK